MKTLRSIVIFIFFVIMVSCRPTIYSRIVDIKNEYNSANPEKQIVIINKEFAPLKEIMTKLKSVLTENNVIIFAWVNHMPKIGTNDYYCLIYNYDNNKKFYIKNSEANIHDLIISNSSLDFEAEDYILDKYIDKGQVFFDSIAPFTSSEFGTRYELIDTKKKQGFSIQGFTLKVKDR
jgi:hypothetical protein